ncbi:hypothetical protein Leryth_004571 [Lithospermum erythrorhizon]|nr:hypothetical protein Leryth_004571 [Lithospermum erythrorhizon]
MPLTNLPSCNICYKRDMSFRETHLVHTGLSKQIWNIHSDSNGIIYRLLLPGNGFSTLDCEFRDISEAIGLAGTFLLFVDFSVIGLTSYSSWCLRPKD